MTTHELSRPTVEPSPRHVRVDVLVAVGVLAVLVVSRLAYSLV